ncbi:bifunctional peptidase and arginyl-hydroxylase JMJD5 isoform X1 [Bactrocera neohumeralis]|uniref:bifunctional peptidase and arginyl-hydroxylase JMJD5 isoform X1 n=1 Tax=Bactrocera neohumeralis TaxID=98809 RepID=UPI0021658A4F|nr:bifunctional peptidase and arginyl-hydroxylase JMJD5 isoform X1 [Bactrocera neohumeralis]
MEERTEVYKYLPKYKEIKIILENEPEANYILGLAATDVENANSKTYEYNEEVYYLVCSLAEKCWERIHTGHFSAVPLEVRKIYALSNYFKIFYLLCESVSQKQLMRCAEVLDEAILIGCTQGLYEGSDEFQIQLTNYISEALEENTQTPLPIIDTLKRQQLKCDIPVLDCPSIEDFRTECFTTERPALLLNTITHWPALQKWRDLNYIHKLAGNRTVPIEIGSNYTTDEWSQQLVKIRDFLHRQFTNTDNEIEYLAQHELFDQIPALKADIRIPDYCILRTSGSESPAHVSIKAWLGPKNTISPLHYDPEHNLLCQVFGRKHIILAAPADTPNLYAHDSEMLCNTSQLDAAQLDFEKFPLAVKATFYNVTLQAGDCLYIPPKWWHYVRAESESFSVSFWWS